MDRKGSEAAGGSSKRRRIHARKKRLALIQDGVEASGVQEQEEREDEAVLAEAQEAEPVQESAEAEKGQKEPEVGVEAKTTANKKQGYLTTHWFSQVVPSFSRRQLEIIEACGFGFLEHLPLSFRPELRITAYNSISYDADENEMRLDNGKAFPITKQDLEVVMGLKDGKPFPEDVWSEPGFQQAIENLSMLFPQTNRTIVNSDLSRISVTSARNFLYNIRGKKKMEDDECKKFQKAIVLVVVNDLLAPSRYHKEVDPRVVHALEDPQGPGVYDWAGYTIEKLKEASKHLKWQLESDVKGSTKEIGGCTIFLLLFYILRYTNCGINYNYASRPLLRHLPAKKIRSLLKQDEYNRMAMPSYRKISTAKQLLADETKKKKAAKREQLATQNIINWATLGYTKAEGFATREKVFEVLEDEYNRLMDTIVDNIVSNTPALPNVQGTGTDKFRAWLHQMALQKLESKTLKSQSKGYMGPLSGDPGAMAEVIDDEENTIDAAAKLGGRQRSDIKMEAAQLMRNVQAMDSSISVQRRKRTSDNYGESGGSYNQSIQVQPVIRAVNLGQSSAARGSAPVQVLPEIRAVNLVQSSPAGGSEHVEVMPEIRAINLVQRSAAGGSGPVDVLPEIRGVNLGQSSAAASSAPRWDYTPPTQTRYEGRALDFDLNTPWKP